MNTQLTAPAHAPQIKAIKKMIALINALLRDDSTPLDSYTQDRLCAIAEVGNNAVAKAERH